MGVSPGGMGIKMLAAAGWRNGIRNSGGMLMTSHSIRTSLPSNRDIERKAREAYLISRVQHLSTARLKQEDEMSCPSLLYLCVYVSKQEILDPRVLGPNETNPARLFNRKALSPNTRPLDLIGPVRTLNFSCTGLKSLF